MTDHETDAPQTGLSTDDGEDAARGRGPRRAPKRVTAERLHNKALWYLERYASSTDNLRQVLTRWAVRSARHYGDDETKMAEMIEAELERLARVNLLDDRAYAETRVRALARSGASRRKIFLKLKEKGVASETVEDALASLEEETDGDPERAAAIELARKRRLGPWRTDPETRADKRERDMAALARAGFGFDLIREIIDAESSDDLEACRIP